VRVNIYIEGGGKGEVLDTPFRRGWSEFFRAAGLTGRMPRIVRGGGREQTFDKFRQAVENARSGRGQPGELPLLLVDSEGAVREGHSTWDHLGARDRWERPEGAGEEQAFLMVQIMETWFLADPQGLAEYFGPELASKHLRQGAELEGLPKQTVLEALDRATRACPRPYAKGKISFELLARLDPGRVEAACPHAKALLDHLRQL